MIMITKRNPFMISFGVNCDGPTVLQSYIPPLRWCDDLPDAVLVAGVNVREGGAGDGPVVGVNDSSTGVLTASLVRVKLVPDTTGTGVTCQQSSSEFTSKYSGFLEKYMYYTIYPW